MAKKGSKRPKWVLGFRVSKEGKPTLITDTRDPWAIDEAEIESAWRKSGDLRVIADRLAACRLRNEPPPEWVHRAVLDLANSKVDTKPYAKQARSLVRYLAVREAHDRKGLSWDEAKEDAAETLRGQRADASPDRMWAEYKKVRKALRAAGVHDDDPGYRWIDRRTKTPR
jgi:hypothetical protein